MKKEFNAINEEIERKNIEAKKELKWKIKKEINYIFIYMNTREILIFITLDSETFPVGKLYCYINKGRESTIFEYYKS